MMIDNLPDPKLVGHHAAEIFDNLQQDPEYDRLVEATKLYPDCWATFTGYPLVSRLDLQQDAEPLIREALRVMALKAAVYALTGEDEGAAELVVSAPVDEMVHAILAQFTLLVRIQDRQRTTFIHATDRERFGWTRGDYTELCYRAGWGQEPPARYWIDADETSRRLNILAERYAGIGVHDGGRRIDLAFDTA